MIPERRNDDDPLFYFGLVPSLRRQSEEVQIAEVILPKPDVHLSSSWLSFSLSLSLSLSSPTISTIFIYKFYFLYLCRYITYMYIEISWLFGSFLLGRINPFQVI